MYIARILYPVRVLGPGSRIGIWFDGCPHHCDGCSNPELWDFSKMYKTSAEFVMRLIRQIAAENPIDGFTLTGGDPFFQPEALCELLPQLNEISRDIICYTGFDKEQIEEKYKDLTEQIAVLIDGRYIKEKNNGVILRGSDNQRVIIYRREYKDVYDKYLAKDRNEIQNFNARGTIISVGIHDRDYEERLKIIADRKGLREI